MRPPSPIEPFSPSDAITLHPTLQAVLDNLDVQIDAELSRYRRQRRNPNATPRRRPIAASAPDAIGILKQNIQLPQPQSSIYESSAAPAKPIACPQPPARTAAQPAPQPVTQPAPQPVTQPVTQPATQSPPIQTWVAPAPVAPPVPAPAAAPDPAAITSYAEQYDLSVYAPDSVLQRLMQQLEPVTAPAAAPAAAPGLEESDEYRDYLASSEELLRSIAEEESMRQPDQEPNSLLDTLLTPLGIGSMLLLLLSSTTLGYVVMNPSSIGLRTAEDTASPAAKTANPANSADSSATENLPSPNLAAEEFRDLGLDTLSSIPKSGASRAIKPSSSSASPSKQATPLGHKSASADTEPKTRLTELPIVTTPELPAAPAVEPNFSTVVIPAQQPAAPVSRPVQPAARKAAPPPAPAISPEPISIAPPPVVPIQPAAPVSEPATAAAPSDPSQGRYYVVTEYSGDPSLQEAREVVPDAYVRNIPDEGAKVQMGAFSDEAKAQQLQQDLRQQGIETEVYRP
ncbi:MAG: SPOR domain-containing protein [Pegethrix bostrychoides GSE-TBD4-15B]|uniref:SPOR domain-containing protein n=1 Tax=Pegethrix bostrychoides GSE-TBD4-15B TaxID=2839662 RepID=A0A951P857_9CYAN|nr:SPOR domain-containing protein [Pegethrix bostrychoides GSE-TBD4-15B]